MHHFKADGPNELGSCVFGCVRAHLCGRLHTHTRTHVYVHMFFLHGCSCHARHTGDKGPRSYLLHCFNTFQGLFDVFVNLRNETSLGL